MEALLMSIFLRLGSSETLKWEFKFSITSGDTPQTSFICSIETMIAQSIRDFAEKNIRPYIMEWDEAQIFPTPLFKKLGAMGFMGILVPEELGGSGLGYHEYITIIMYQSYFGFWK